MANPGAVRIFVFIDEREDANSWANFFVDMAGYSPVNGGCRNLYDLPASYHGNAGGLPSPMATRKSTAGRTLAPCRSSFREAMSLTALTESPVQTT